METETNTMSGNPKHQERTLWPSAVGWPEIIPRRLRNQNGNGNQVGHQGNMMQELQKIQMQIVMNMMQQQQAAAKAQVPTQTPLHQQQQPAQQHMQQQQNFGYRMQMPHKYGGISQQMPTMQQKFNMGQTGGQRFF